MTIGACDGLPALPFDYEKEPLVTSSVKLNTDNLKIAVRWLVDCVQDQQQALARHGKRLDDSTCAQWSEAPADKIQKPDAEGQMRQSLSDGFGNILRGELLDMKINAVNRALKAEIPRISDLDSERARMLADTTSLQRDLTTRFQEADKKIHAELAVATNKLFEQLSRISSDVISRIEALEQKVDSNAADLALMKEVSSDSSSAATKQSPPTPTEREPSGDVPNQTSPAPIQIDRSDGISKEVVARVEVLEQQAKEMERKVDSSLTDLVAVQTSLAALERNEESASAKGNADDKPSKSGNAEVPQPEQPVSSEIADADQIQPDNSGSASSAATEPAAQGGADRIGSWADVEETLSKMEEAQRKAINEARNDLTDMGAALQAENSERLRLRDDVEALREAHVSATDASREAHASATCAVNQLESKVSALQDGLAEIHPREAASQSGSQLDAPQESAHISPASEVQEVAAETETLSEPPGDDQQPAEQEPATSGPSLQSLIHGAVGKVSEGKQSFGVKDESKDRVKEAFIEEAVGWLNQSGSESSPAPDVMDSIGLRGAIPRSGSGSMDEEGPMHDNVSRRATSEHVVRLEERVSRIESQMEQKERELEEKETELEKKLNELQCASTGGMRALDEGAGRPENAAQNADANDNEAKQSVCSLQSRMVDLEQRFDEVRLAATSPMGSPGDVKSPSSPDEVKSSGNNGLEKRIFELEERTQVLQNQSPVKPAEFSAMQEAHEVLRKKLESLEQALVGQPPAAKLAAGADVDFQRVEKNLRDMVTASQETMQNDFTNLGSEIQDLKRHMEQFRGKTAEILSRLSDVEGGGEAGAGKKSQELELSAGSEGQSPSGSRVTLPPLTDILDDALDKPDLSHLMDASRGGTPSSYVSKRGLQQAVDGLTADFRSWLDAIHQSLLAALQSKADSSKVDDIAKQVRDAAGRASDSVASFAKRAVGGHCASCDAPLSNEMMRWRKPAPGGSQGRWMPSKSHAAYHTIRPPTGLRCASIPNQQGPLPKLTDFRQHPLLSASPRPSPRVNGRLVHRDFPKGKVLQSVASEPEMVIQRLN